MSEITDPDLNKKLEKKYGVSLGESTIHNSHEYNTGTMQRQLIHEELNTAMNWHPIVSAIKNNRARDISDEPKVDKDPCFILGSGPSLDNSIKYLKDWKGGIICTTSHALSLIRHGVEPTHILILDPFCIWDEIKGIDWSKTRTKLITHPGAHPSIIEKWPNEMLLYIQKSNQANSFYATTQKRMYTHREGDLRNPEFHFYIKTEIVIFACSPPMQMFVADKLGYGDIFLAGCDFGYHTDKARFTDYTVKKEGYFINAGNSESVYIEPEWEAHEHLFTPNETMKLSNNGLYTEEIHLYYKKNMISAWRLSLQNVYTTDNGILTEIPYVDVKKAIYRQGFNLPKLSKQAICKRTERYLASVNAFVVETGNGISFVESTDYKKELLDFMTKLKLQYGCDKCGIGLQSNDGKDRVNEKCPQCKEGVLHYAINIDIDYNMKKFEHLYNMTHEEVK